MKTKLLTLSIICILLQVPASSVQGQSPSPYFPKTPASPNAAELGKFGAVPVSYYSGLPNIDIPLYKFQCGNFTLPISLSYHGGGIRVNDIASWVGLGWNLNAGGGITVNIKGKFDFAVDTVHIRTKEQLQNLRIPTDNQLRDLAQHLSDAEPDIYNYNFCGFSGQFTLDQNFNVHFLKNNGNLEFECRRIHISPQSGYSRGHWQARFQATDNDGNKYYFNVYDSTIRENYYRDYDPNTQHIYDDEKFEGDNRSIDEEVEATSWMLTKIELKNGLDYINFHYDFEDLKYESGYTGTLCAYNKYYTPPYSYLQDFSWQPGERVFHRSRITNHVPVLRSITFSRDGSKVLFKSDIARDDIISSKALSQIELFNNDTNRILVWVFNYDNYFNSNVGYNDWFDNPLYLRLKLNSLTKKSGDLSVSEPPYVFKYFGDDSGEPILPQRNCFNGFDHWGFMNISESEIALNSNNPNYLFPKLENAPIPHLDFICQHTACQWNQQLQKCMGNGSNDIYNFMYLTGGDVPDFQGGKRESNGDYAKTFSIKEIQYPTGGYSKFDYESNSYSSTYSSTSGYSSGTCGGIRIKSIIDSPDGLSEIPRTFYYESGVGVLFGEPVYLQPVFSLDQYESGYQNGFLLCGYVNPNPGGTYYTGPFIGGYNLYSNPIESNGMFGADNIGYSTVVETTPSGSTIYHFTSGVISGNYQNNYFPNSYNYNYVHREVDMSTNNTFYSSIYGGNHPIFPLSLDYTTGELTGSSYKRGLLWRVEYWNPDMTKLFKMDEYDFDFTDMASVIGNRVANVEDSYFIDAFYLQTGKSFLKSKTETLYDNSSNQIAKQTTNSSNPNTEQLKLSSFVNSNSDIINTTYIYPNDIQSGGIHGCTPEACGLNQLNGHHQLSNPMETIEAKNNQLIKANLTTYKTLDDNNSSTSIPVPYREYAIESNTPFTKDNTVVTENSGTGLYELTFDSKYKMKAEYSFDQYCNMISYLKTDDYPIAYYYGYSSTLPVIEAKNVTSSGLNSAVSGIPIVNGNFENFIKDIGDLNNQTKRDNWRTFNSSLHTALPSARITTYTYIPLIGITSKTDENGIATYYCYDALGRLICEKDDKNNIVKKYDYHYTGQ
ncbi:MAG: hypothetical protein NTW10_12320 [Bacteroidetes bacterium]|nr:hypothetical protein [Bacteroidota bacterium]